MKKKYNSLNNIFNIFKKEIKSNFYTPTAYIIISAFLILSEFLFFKQVFLIDQASLRSYFSIIPWLFLLLIPALTMGSLSQEKNDGTIEYLVTKPIREIEIIIGKFLAILAFIMILMAFTIPIAISLSNYGNLDFGVFAGQYIASISLAIVMISLGIAISSLFKNQITSFLLSALTSLVLLITGFDLITISLPKWLSSISIKLSALTHYNSIIRGVIDMRDVWYIVTFTILFLSIAYIKLVKDKFGNQTETYRRYKIGVMLIVLITLFTNLLGSRIPGRIDMTQDKVFTLTNSTKIVLNNLDDIVNITLYKTSELPPTVQPIIDEVQDILNDYEKLSNGRIKLDIKNPDDDVSIKTEMQSYGVQEVQFNTVGQNEFQVKKGTFGIVVTYGTENETIPFVQSTGDLEYQLTSFIDKLTNKNKKSIVFASGYGEKTLTANFTLLQQELTKQFNVNTFEFTAENNQVPADTDVLVIPGSTGAIDEAVLNSWKEFSQNGGSLLILDDGVVIDAAQGYTTTPNATNLIDWLSNEYGVKINKNLAYDLQSNERVSLKNGLFSYLIPYPFWTKALGNLAFPITNNIDNIFLPWSSSIDIDTNKLASANFDFDTLYTTSKAGGEQISNFNIDPNQTFSQSNLKELTLAVALHPKDSNKMGNIIVVGDSDFIADDYVQNSPNNGAFAMESISWLSQENSLASIKIKQQKDRSLLFTNPKQPDIIKYTNLALAIIIPFVTGFIILFRRKKKQYQNYNE